jgi:hypothetical protein
VLPQAFEANLAVDRRVIGFETAYLEGRMRDVGVEL